MANAIQLDIYISGVDNKPRPLIVEKSWMIDRLLLEINKKFKPGVPPESMKIICAGKPLTYGSGKTVKDFGFLVHGARVDLCQQVIGGMSSLVSLTGYVELTTEPCDITYDDDEETRRAKMPCDCAISVEAMKDMCNDVLDKGKYRFNCPCCPNYEWDFFVVKHVLSAILSEEQLVSTSKAVNANYFQHNPDIQQCPMCHTYSERNFDVPWPGDRNRVVCLNCTNTNGGGDVEFCWGCLQEWNSKVKHDDCDGTKSKVRYLATCETKTIGLVDGCPAIRGCPRCGMMLWHKEACKYMTCPPPCNQQFCFVCLKPMDENGEWQCDGYNDVCEIAPRQTSLPK